MGSVNVPRVLSSTRYSLRSKRIKGRGWGKRKRMCSSRKYPYPPQGRLTEIPRGKGVPKAQFFNEKYGTKVEFPEGVEGSS